MAQLSSPHEKLISLLRERLSPEDVQVIADDYGERCGNEKNSNNQKKSLYDRLVDKAGAAHAIRLLVLHATNRKDMMGLIRVVSDHCPDVQQAIHASGFELSSSIRVYLANLLKEISTDKERVVDPLTSLRLMINASPGLASEVSLDAFLSNHPRVILIDATPIERSAILRNLAKRLASEWQASGPSSPVPVLVELKRWFNPKLNLLQFLQAQITWSGIPQLAEQLPDLMRAGRIVLLLEGIDELPYSKRHEITGLRDDARVRSIDDWSEERAWRSVRCVLSCKTKDFIAGPSWYTLLVFNANQKPVLDLLDSPAQRLKTHINKAIERVAGQMTDSEAAELQTRLSYLALNMTYAEQSRQSRRDLSEDRQTSVEKNVAADWLFHLRKIEEKETEHYSQPEATPEEQKQAARLLQLAENAGLLISSGEEVLFTHQHIRSYFCLCYCLKQALDDPQFLERLCIYEFRTIWRLWREFDPTLVDKLLELLKRSDNSDLRNVAAYILRWLDDSRAVEPLISALGDENSHVRSNAAVTLGNLADNRAVEPLIAIFKDDVNPHVRKRAAFALGEIEDERRIEPLLETLSDKVVRNEIISVLCSIRDQRLIEPLVALLADDSFALKEKEALAAYGEAAVPALMVALIDPEVEEQYKQGVYLSLVSSEASYNAAKVLGEIGDIRPLPLLLWLKEHGLGESHYGKVRHAAAEAVEKIQKRHQAAAPLVAALRHEDRTMRTAAAFALGLLEDRRAIEPLLDVLLHDEHARFRWGAAKLLGNIGDPRAIVPLLKALEDGGDYVSSEAADALHRFGELAVSPLIVALRHEDSNVRRQAAYKLGGLHNKQAVEPLIVALADEDNIVRRNVVFALGALGDRRALEPLIVAANHPDIEVREWVPSAVFAIDPDRVVEMLIAALKDEHEYVRYRAAQDLSKMGDKRAVEALIAALKDESPRVREYAGYALSKCGDSRAVEQLIENLHDEFGSAAMAAATALGDIGDSRAIEPLIARLPDKHQQDCTYVAEALEKFGACITPTLIAALKDEGPDAAFYSKDLRWKEYYWELDDLVKNAHLRYYVAKILGKVGEVGALPILMWMAAKEKNETEYGEEKVRDAAAQAVESIRQRHLNTFTLVAGLAEQDPLVRIGSGFALGMLGDERATETLIGALEDNDRRTRWGAARLLGNIGGNQPIASLISVLGDTDIEVRRNAAAALIKIGGEPTVRMLIAAFGNVKSDTYHWITHVLKKIGEAAIHPLIAALRDENSDAHNWTLYMWIAYALSQIGEAALHPLIAALNDQDSNVRYWVAHALGRMGDSQAVGPLMAALEDEDPAVRLSVAAALTKLGDSQAIGLLLVALKDEKKDVRCVACINLGITVNTQAIEPLILALNDADSDVRYWAIIALGDIGDDRALLALEQLVKITKKLPHVSESPVEKAIDDSQADLVDDRLRRVARQAIQRIQERQK